MLRKIAKAFFVAAVLAIATPTIGQPNKAYEVVSGDQIEVSFNDAREPFILSIDIDGEIRFRGIGGIPIEGQTLDAAESTIEQALAEAGLFIDPDVTISIAKYAPIFINGDVTSSGIFDYFPKMTVSAALGLAGGLQVTTQNRLMVQRAQNEARGRLQQEALEIADSLATIAGHQAFLEEKTTANIPPEKRAAIPKASDLILDKLLETETALLLDRLSFAKELQRNWSLEIENLEKQRELLSKRLVIQNASIENIAKDLEVAKSLRNSGLQTAPRMMAALQRDADARASALEIETALITIDRSIAETNRRIFTSASTKRQETLVGLRRAEQRFENSMISYSGALDSLSILERSSFLTAEFDSVYNLAISIISNRPGRSKLVDIDQQTLLLPGDTVSVHIELKNRGDR